MMPLLLLLLLSYAASIRLQFFATRFYRSTMAAELISTRLTPKPGWRLEV
jgi:hypothetical protein